jgi:predicted O-linked N-acetylglucosamine transferase (SPINDLY family)
MDGALPHGARDLAYSRITERQSVESMNDRDARLAEGRAHHLSGRLGDAAASYRAALAIDGDHPEALHLLGLTECAAGNAASGIALIARAVKKRPWVAAFHCDLGTAQQMAGEIETAIASFRQALKLQPTLVAAHNNLGMALKAAGRLDEAASAYRKALTLAPSMPELHNNLGNVLDEQGALGDAIACFERAIALRPDNASTHHNLANCLLRQGRVAAAVTELRTALRLQPDLASAGTNLLMALQYDPDADAATLLDAAKFWAARQPAAPRAMLPAGRDTLRVGYVCGDFREHPTAFFIESLIAAQAGSAVEPFCYANQTREDALSARLRRHAAGWRRIETMNAERAAAAIRADGIDVLIDLSGHTKDNRLDVFALRAAPLQIAWYAYPGTTGLATMDRILADDRVLPATDERFFTERPLRLPDCYLCFTPPTEPIAPGPPPHGMEGAITFGSFNNPAKISPDVIALWAEILQAVPHSRLALAFRFLADPATADRFRTAFAAHGIAPDRLTLDAFPSRTATLAAYRTIDVALDPFPYNGTTTSCEALWMGVPLVALRGTRFAGRVSETLLATIGHEEWLADDAAHYVAIATRLATDSDRLATLRTELRPRLLASPLCDAPRFANSFEQAIRSAL